MHWKLSPVTTVDNLTINQAGPHGLPIAPMGGVPYMHPVSGAFGDCAGCSSGQMYGLNDTTTWWDGLSTTEKIIVGLLGAGAIYGSFKLAKKVMR